MKRFIAIISLLVILIAGCTFQPAETPAIDDSIGGNTAGTNIMYVTDVEPWSGTYTQLNDNDADENHVQDVIYITLDKVLSSDNISSAVDVIENGNLADFEGTIEYERDFKRIKISGTFGDDAAYVVRLSADDLTSINGDYLDGNGNDVKDGSPYDDILLYFYTGTGNSEFKDYTHPELTDFGPVQGQWPNDSGVWVVFDEAMDSASVVNNIELTESDGDAVSGFDLIGMSADSSTYVFFLDTVKYEEVFTVTLTCADITDAAGNVMVPWNEEYTTDTPADFEFKFMTEAEDPTDDDTPLHVNSVNFSGNYIEVDFDDDLDPATVTSENIKVMYYSNGWYNLEGEIVLTEDGEGFQFSTINLPSHSSLKIIIYKAITDDEGWMLDSNGNMIGGEEYDPTRKGYTSSDNYEYTIY
ncbi:MAG: Ig-like domain-containing protein [bacterium]